VAVKVWILGSGTLLPDSERGSPGYWLEPGEEDRVLMECGAGSLRTLAALGRDWGAVTHLLLSHFHTDHVGELASLFFALKHGTGRSAEEGALTLLGPRGLTDHLDALALAHGDFIRNPGFPLEVVELSPGVPWVSDTGSFSVEAYATRHTDASLAFRLRSSDGAKGTVGYTGDTGPDGALGSFMSGCDLLIAECSLPDSVGMDTHLTPASLAELARVAEPAVLVTVHVYPPLSPEGIPDLISRKGYTGRVLAGRDGMSFAVRRGDVTLLARGS